IEDRQRSGRPSQVDEERLKQLVEADPHQTSSELAAVLGLSYRTLINHLHAIGKVNKLDQWVPHDLSDWDRQRRVEAAVSLLSFARTTAWLDSVVTGDEKWVLHINVKRKRSWTDVGSLAQTHPKIPSHTRKAMLCDLGSLGGAARASSSG